MTTVEENNNNPMGITVVDQESYQGIVGFHEQAWYLMEILNMFLFSVNY